MITARLMVETGVNPEVAMKRVGAVRPEAIGDHPAGTMGAEGAADSPDITVRVAASAD